VLGKQEYSGENLLKKSKKLSEQTQPKYSIKSRIEPVPHGCQARASTGASNLLLVACYETTRPQCMCTLVITLPVSTTELSLPSLLHCLIPPHSLTLICFQLQLHPHLKVHPFSPEYRRRKKYELSVL